MPERLLVAIVSPALYGSVADIKFPRDARFYQITRAFSQIMSAGR